MESRGRKKNSEQAKFETTADKKFRRDAADTTSMKQSIFNLRSKRDGFVYDAILRDTRQSSHDTSKVHVKPEEQAQKQEKATRNSQLRRKSDVMHGGIKDAIRTMMRSLNMEKGEPPKQNQQQKKKKEQEEEKPAEHAAGEFRRQSYVNLMDLNFLEFKKNKMTLKEKKLEFIRVMSDDGQKSLTETFYTLDPNCNGSVNLGEVSNAMDYAGLNITQIPPSEIFSWLTSKASLTIEDLIANAHAELKELNVYMDYSSSSSSMPNTVTLDPVNLSAACNGQRLSHGAAYYKIRHPLVKYSEFMISMKKKLLRDKKKKEIKSFMEQLSSMAEIDIGLGALGNFPVESEIEESGIGELQKKTESCARRRGFDEELSDDVDNDDIFAPLIKQNQKEHFTLTNALPALLDEDSPRKTEHQVLRRRGGTLLYDKSEAAELRTRLWYFCLDMGQTKLGPQTQDDEKQTADQLRSNYIRLNLYANRPIKICRWPVEPINVLWRRDEDLQSLYAKASNTKARPLYGFVSCMYTPLLRKVKNVGELVDGGHYLLTSLGDSVEFPLPPLFQEKKEVMTIAENTKQSLTEKILRFLKQDMSQSLMQMANERFTPVQWCRLLTQEAGLDVNEKYFHWLSNSSAFSYLQLVEVLDDRLRQPLPMLTSKELGRKRCNRRPSVALEGDPLALIIDQILDKNGDDNPAIRLAANRDKLEKNKLKQMTLMHDIKQQRFLPAIEDVKRKHQCVAL